jgi:diguanylate cyclase (GGDEF)-like protein
MLRIVRNLSLTVRFAITAALITAVIGVVMAQLLNAAVTRVALQNARAEARDAVAHQVVRQLTPQDLQAPMTGARLQQFDWFVKNSVISDRTARMKVWSPDGRVIYSDDPAEIGGSFPTEDELREALQGETASDVSAGDKAENTGERRFGRMLEVYTPIVFPDTGQVAGAFEIYQYYAPVASQLMMLQRTIGFGLFGGLLLLYVASLGIVHSGARTIEHQHQELERAFREQEEGHKARERLISVLDATTDFVTISDRAGRPLYVNEAARRTLAIDVPEDGDGPPIDQIYTDWARTFLEEEGLPAALQSGVWNGETAMHGRDGTEIPVSQVLVAHKTESGELDFLSSVARDISERKYYETQLVHLASHDALTGLYNRRRFDEEVERELAQTRRFGSHGALLLLDLDAFKGVNDSLGHHAGDQFLIGLSVMLRSTLREIDLLARLGGDEFAILLPQTGPAEASGMVARVLETVRRFRIIINGEPVRATTSIGVALYPDHGLSAGELLVHADLALYEAKEVRDEWRLYTPQRNLQPVYAERRFWEQRLREALEQQQFMLYLQPIQSLHGGRGLHYEALLRLRDGSGAVIPPGVYMDTAERTGIIRYIDRWVVKRAIQLIADHDRAGRELVLEVNLSGKALADQELLNIIKHDIAESGIDPARLILEITETAAIADVGEARSFISTLKDLGCRFALDDFGVGFSSFSYLKHLPVDYLKIDGSFIRNLPRDAVDQHLVKAMVEVARGLGKRTIAEFVEEAETLTLLCEYGVDYAQGYHVGRPEPAARQLAAMSRSASTAQLERSPA